MVHVYTHNSRPRIWLRFIDNIWGLFHGDKPEFNQFLKEINSKHVSINFLGNSNKKVDFFDVTAYRNETRILSKLYCKPTDSHSYYDFSVVIVSSRIRVLAGRLPGIFSTSVTGYIWN